jgi:flavorubredoxin
MTENNMEFSNEYEYKKISGSFYYQSVKPRAFNLYDIRFMTDEVSLLIDQEEGILLNHGKPSTVSDYMKKLSQYMEPGVLIIMTSNRWKDDQLTSLLTHSGLVTRLLNPTTQASFFE